MAPLREITDSDRGVNHLFRQRWPSAETWALWGSLWHLLGGHSLHCFPWHQELNLRFVLSKRQLKLHKSESYALAGLLRWLEHHPVHPKVTSLIASQGTYVSGAFDPWSDPQSGHIQEATHRSMFLSQINVSLCLFSSLLKSINSSNWCGSVGWALSCKLKGYWFNSQSGHMPGFEARSWLGACEREPTDWWLSHTLMFLFLSFSLTSLSLKVNK